MIEGRNTILICTKIVLTYGGFAATVFLEKFRFLIVICITCVQYYKIFQLIWSETKAGLVLIICRNILSQCSVNFTGLRIIAYKIWENTMIQQFGNIARQRIWLNSKTTVILKWRKNLKGETLKCCNHRNGDIEKW